MPIDHDDVGKNNVELEGGGEDIMDRDDQHDVRRGHRLQGQRNGDDDDTFLAEVCG
jgi:hypothetical protein